MADDQYQDPPVDEFGIPIRKKSDEKPLVDEFGIPVKKKEKENGFWKSAGASADGGEAGSFAGSFGELAGGTAQKSNADKVKDFISRLEKPKMIKQGAPKVFDTPVRITAEDVQTEIERPQPFNLIMMAKAEQGDKGAELTLLEKEKPLLEDFTLKEVTGQVTDTDLQNLKGTYYGQKYLQQLFQKYNVLPNRKPGEEMADLLFAINKENAKTGYDMQNQVFEGIDNDILEFYKDKQGILYPENPSVATFTKLPLKSEDIVVPDLSNQQSISDAISQLQKSVSVVGKDGPVKDREKIDEVIKLLRGKLYWMQSSTGVDPEINEFDSQIEKAVTRFNIDREKYETVKTEDFAKDDELNAAHFKQGLSYLKYSNPELYKNTVRTLVQRQYVADRDMEEIMLLGQEIINNKAFRLGTFDENFVNKQTYFDYTSKDTKKSDIAVKIGERLKELGYKQGAKYNPDLIKGVGDELGLNPGLVQELAEDEQIKWGGAIPKSGLGAAYVRGVDNVLESLSNSLDKFFGESPADSYLKSRKLDTDFGQKIVYVNNKNEVRTVNYLPSDRNNLLREIMEGTGKFVVQAAGAYVAGGPLGLIARAGGATTSAATNIRNFAGTYLSSFFQAYGPSYDDWLQKTGDERTAATAANFAGHFEGATELFLPDIVVADKISNVLRKSYGKDLVQVFKNAGTISQLRSGLKPIIKNTINAVSRGSSVLGKENAEELVNNLGNYVLETFLSPKTAAKKDLLKETVETVRATSIDMIVPAILGGVGGSSREFTRQSLDDAAVNYRQSKRLLSDALANGDISDAAYEQALSTLTIHRSNLVTAPKTDAEGNKLSKAAQRRYAFEKTASWVLGQQAEKQTDDVIRKPLEEKAKLAEKTREEIYNPDEKTKAQNNVELQIEAAEERMYNNISEIDQSDIDEKEKEDLIAKEEAAHVEEVKRIAEELLPKADIITEQTKSEDSLQPKAENKLTIEEEINELENEKADIETAAAEDGLTQEDEDMIAEIDRRIDDLKRQKEDATLPTQEASTGLSRGDENAYHGSPIFKEKGVLTPSKSGELGAGVYFTRNNKLAENYSQPRGEVQNLAEAQSKSGVAELNLSNLKIKKLSKEEYLDKRSEFYDTEKKLNNGDWNLDIANSAEKKLIDFYEKEGYDGLEVEKEEQGVIFPNSVEKINYKGKDQSLSSNTPSQAQPKAGSGGVGVEVKLPKGAKEVFHYSENENLKELEDREGGTWFTDNSYGYQRRGGVKGKVSKVIEPDKLKLASEKDVWEAGNGDWAEGVKKIKEQGFDGIKQTADGDKNYLIFDLKNVKDKSEYKPTTTQETTPVSEAQNNIPNQNQQQNERQEKGQEELLGSDKQQAPDVVPGDNNSGGAAVSPAVSQYRQEWKPKSKRNKYKVTYDKNGKREVRIKGNGFKISEDHPAYNRILREHAAQYNYNVGQTTEAIPDKPQFNDKNEADIWLVENSQNPAEIAYAYSNMERQPVDMSSKEAAISREIGKVKRTSFNQFGDRNKVTFGMAKTYFNQQEGETLDNIAQRASRYGEGLDVTENDVVEFMLKFPYGVWPDSTVKSEAQRLAEDKFEELTGIPLNPGNGSMTVANRAAAQYTGKIRQQVMEAMPDNAEDVDINEVTGTESFTGWKPLEGESLFDNDKNKDNDKATQDQSDQGGDGSQPGNQSSTGQGTRGPEGGSGGTNTGRDSGQEDGGEGQEGRGIEQGQEAGYTIEDFQKEIREIGPLDEFSEDDLRNMETPFMAATDNEAKLKAAQNVLAKAQRELNNAEDKIAKTQASQGGMFGQAAQGSMFAVNRNEAGEILGPLREAVKTARAEVDRLTAIVNDERRQADGQMSLFDAIQRQYPPATMKAFNKVQRAIESMFGGISGFKGVKVLTGEDFQSAIAITGADTSFSFVGVYAMLGDARNSWGRAVEMSTNGESADAIFNETGWFYDDLDNKWKYELKREGFVYKPEISPNDFKQAYVKNLDEVINYPELFEAYPEFRNFKVYGAPYKDISGAGGNGRILVNTSDSKYEQRQTILHEIQHEIQRREGFARGANREDGVRKVDEISRQTTERIAGLQKLRDSAVQQEVAEIDALIEVEQDYLNYIESNKENLADYFYAMYAGEIEARNIEARTLPRNRRKNPLATRDEIIDGRINHVTVDFDPRFMAKPDGTVYGFLHNGTIYINGDHLNLNTPIHEAAHLFTRWAQANAPELYAAGQRLAGTSRAMLKIKADPFYQKQAQRMRDAGRSEADIEAMFRDEALAFNVGNRGQFIADSQKSAFREWLKKFWNKIKAFFGKGDTKLEKMSAEQFSNMSFDSFSQAMAERILSGERLEGGVQDTGTSFMATINSKGARLAQAVQKLLATGFTEAQVKQQLMSNGFSDMVADNIIANAKRLPKYKPLVKKAKGNIVATPGDQITFDGNIDNRATKAYKAAKRWAKKYFTVNKGLPEFVLPLAEKTRGTQNWAINQAYKTVKQLKEAAKKIGFTDWDAVDAALRGLKGLKFTQPLSGQTDIQLFDPVMANNNRPLTAPPATIPQVLLNMPAELRPIVLKMRAQIDGLSHELTVNGYISPEQALVFEENLGEYVTRTYALFNDKNWAKKLQKEHPEIINEAIQFIYEQRFNEIKQADPTMPDDDARKQAEVDARRKVLDILEGMDMEYNPTKTKTVKGRDNGILQRREDIPEPIRKLMGEYTDPGAAFMQTIARMATLRGQAKFLADIRDIGMGTMFWERDDPNRPDDANVELRSPASATWFPLGGLYTTKEVADFFNEMEYVRNAAVQFWMNFVGAVRWGKTVGSVVTQFKNWESNIGFSIMNGHFYPGESGDAWAYLWDQMKWWNGEKIESDLLTDASQLGLIGQNVGINELRDMFSSDGVAKMITAASTQNPSLLRRLKKSPKQVFEYLNKLYSASDDFFKLYGFVNERKILAKAMYGNDFESLSAEDKAAVNKEAAERVKNTYPTYDRVWEGAKYLSKNMPIFGNFLSFQAESIRVLLNSFQYAINDLKNPAMRSAGLRRIAGITTYLGSRYAILYAIAQVTGFGMKGLFGGDDDDKEQAMEDISRFTMPFMANSEKLVRNVGPGKYVVYDLMSIEPYGIWFKTINALRDGLPEGISEFFGPFMEKEMTFETYQKLAANESGRGGRIFDPNDPLGNKVKDGLAFAWQQLKPSTVGFIQRAIQRDDKFNEAMALMGARGYSLDVTNAFSIKVYKAEEEKAELVKDFFAAIKPLKDKAEIEKVVQEFKGKLIKVTKELAEDRLAALRLGADQEEIDERIYKASKKMIDVWGTDEIMLILGETDEAGFIFDKLGNREINKKNGNSVDSIKEGVKSVAR